MTHADPFNIEATPLDHGGGETLPAFALIDDAGGRFVIDAVSGVVSVAHEDIVTQQRDAVHSVRLQITEPNGARYEITMRLKITGLVPRMAGDDFFTDAPEADATEHCAPAAEIAAHQEPIPFSLAHWLAYAAFSARQAEYRARAHFAAAAYGAALPAPAAPQVKTGRADLALRTPAFNAMPDAWLHDV